MKVLHVLPSFMVGGAERLVLNYLKNVDSSKLELHAISLYPPTGSIYDDEIKTKQLPVTYLHKKSGLDISVISPLKQAIREFSPDVIHTHMSVLKYVALTGAFKKTMGFHTIHSEINKDANVLDRRFNAWLFQKGVIPIALHEKAKDAICNSYHISEVEVVGNGIAIREYEHITDLRETLGLKKSDYVLGNVGRLSLPKNHLFLLNVFAMVKKARKEAKLLLVGDGDQKEQIREKIQEMGLEEAVLLLGNRGDIPALLKTMDVFVFPSLYEGLGISVLEAQAAGLNCVVSTQVPEAACLMKNVKRLDLSIGTEKWAKEILGKFEEEKRERKNVMEEVNIDTVLEKLMQIYQKYRSMYSR